MTRISALFIRGVICYSFDDVVRFISGVLGIIWSIFWWFFSFERPSKSPYITEAEKIYIETSIGENTSIAQKVGYTEITITFFV